MHLICEAVNGAALARGMKRFKLRVCNGINRQLGRKGSVFLDRYHMEIMRMPLQVRNTVCYVLQNARRHKVTLDPAFNGVDPFSSAWWFDGWKENGWRAGVEPPSEACVSPARTWLLSKGWRQHGLIKLTEVPPAAR